MAERAATRAALLARPGAACDRLGAALRDAGAEVVLVGDPRALDPDALRVCAPQAVLVALEPAIEDSLDRFDGVLNDPSVTVIFDEADLAAQRVGWDAARWGRHLAAKLNGHLDVLPPAAERDGQWPPSPGALPVALASMADSAVFASAAQTLAGEAPRDDGVSPTVALQSSPLERQSTATDAGDRGIGGIVLVDSGARLDVLADIDSSRELSLVDDAAPALVSASADSASATDVGSRRYAHDLDALDQRAATLSLADTDSYGHGPLRGAVVVDAGLGGPDAVRQLLSGLPESFPRPVIVRLQLNGGRYDRLVKQMQRASGLPVALAQAGAGTDPGTVYFLPAGLTLARSGANLQFADADTAAAGNGWMDVLPASDSALLLFSGSDVALVERAMTLLAGGALVAGQSLLDCYDSTAASALIAQGALSGTPVELAERLAERWPPLSGTR
ncbi:MAG: chemotaxis protein CheB [Luteimonas sp.]